MNKPLLEKYAELERQIAELEDKKEEYRGMILEEMQTEEVDTIKAEFGTFSVINRKTWEYSPKVEALQEKVKEQKKQEESDGTAKFEEKKSLAFRVVKETK